MFLHIRATLFALCYLPIFVFLLSGCASDGDNAQQTSSNTRTSDANYEFNEIPVSDKWRKFPIEVFDESGNPISNALIASTRWEASAGERIGREDYVEPLSKTSLQWLMGLNERYWLDMILHKPTLSLRQVGITNNKGVVTENVANKRLDEILNSDPARTVPYAVYKEGYVPAVIEISLDSIVKKQKLSVVLSRHSNVQNENKTSSDVFYDAARMILQSEILGHGHLMVITVVSSNHPQANEMRMRQQARQALPAKLLDAQTEADKKGNLDLACRLKYWRAKILSDFHFRERKPFDVQNAEYQVIKDLYADIKNHCGDHAHIQSLRLIDEYLLHRRETRWIRENKTGLDPLEMSQWWARFKLNWIDEAEKLQAAAGNTLWPVFYRQFANMYYQGYPDDQYRLLTWFKENYSVVYTAWDERNRATAAYSYGIRSKKHRHNIGNLANLENIRERTLTWLERAANIGLCLAYQDLGEMYEEGIFVDIDFDKALFWYRGGLTNGCSIPPYREKELEQGVLRTLKKASITDSES